MTYQNLYLISSHYTSNDESTLIASAFNHFDDAKASIQESVDEFLIDYPDAEKEIIEDEDAKDIFVHLKYDDIDYQLHLMQTIIS